MDQCPLPLTGMPANHSKILPYRSVVKKLLHQRIAVLLSLSEKHDPRGKTINAVHHESALSLASELRGEH